MKNSRIIRSFLFIPLFLFFVSFRGFSQVTVSLSGVYNAGPVATFNQPISWTQNSDQHNESVAYVLLPNFNLYVDAGSGTGTPLVVPDFYGVQSWGWYSHTPQGIAYETYLVGNASSTVTKFTFTPTTANLGSNTVDEYMEGNAHYTAGGAIMDEKSDLGSFIITVEEPRWNSSNPFGSICSNSGIIKISDYFTGNTNTANPVIFYFDNGYGIPGNYITSFDPSTLSPGLHTLTAFKHYDNGDFSSTVNVFINAPDVITLASYPSSVCINGGVVSLQASPSGGTWSGTGVDANGNFTPSVAGLGQYTLTYSYVNKSLVVNPNGCPSTASAVIKVNPLPAVSGGSPFTICGNSTPLPLNDGLPSGGVWSGTGVTNNSFNPVGLLAGDYILNYTYTDPLTGCSASATKDVTVSPLPTVTAGSDLSVCVGSGLYDLSKDASPAGGVFSGNGVVNTSFNPSITGPGLFTVQYKYTSPATGCVVSVNRAIQVSNSPVVTVPAIKSVCLNSGTFILEGASPVGGVYSGAGVSGGVFDPKVAGVGSHIINYSFTDPVSGCTGSSSFIITVTALPIVSAGSNFSVCLAGSLVPLGGSPSGGVWSGTGVSLNAFNPVVSGYGVFKLVYTYTDGHGCVDTSSVLATVNKPTSIILTGPYGDTTVCLNSGRFRLSTSVGGGTWSGTGITGNSFDPSYSGVGVFPLKYSYTDGNGCTSTLSLSVKVIAPPVVSVPSTMSVCLNNGIFSLSGATPIGGVYTGLGVSNGEFNPITAGVGQHLITYTFTDPITGCSSSSAFIVSVKSLPRVVAGSSFSVCVDQSSYVLKSGYPSGGVWSGQGVTSGVFYPSSVGTGDYKLIYSYKDTIALCSDTSSLIVTVKPLPVVPLPFGGDTTVCLNSGIFKLISSVPGGIWSGQGVSGSQFNPIVSGIGSFVVSYTYQAPNSCSTVVKVNIHVVSPPIVSAPATFSVCLNSGLLTLSGATPIGGIYSGVGVSNGVFNPSVAGLGNHIISYSFTDPLSGCTSTTSFIIIVKSLPVVFAGSNFSTCSNGSDHILLGSSPLGGIWSGVGIKNLGSHGFSFSPQISGVGSFILTYTYTDTISGCSNSSTLTATVFPTTPISIGPDTTLCQNASAITLWASPKGGTWSGVGVFGNVFTPSTATAGYDTLTYTYNDVNGCTFTKSRVFHLLTGPVVTVGGSINLCANVTSYDLNQDVSLKGGVWSGNGVEGSFFHPNLVGPGSYVITYTYQNSLGCATVVNRSITVIGLPGVVTISGTGSGCNGDIITLFAQADNAVTYNWYHINDTVPFFSGPTLNYLVTKNEQLYCVAVNSLGCGLTKLKSTNYTITSLSPTATLTASQYNIPFGGLIAFVSSKVYNVQNYLWSFGDGGESTEQSPHHYYYNKGSFPVSVVLTSPEGCVDTVHLIHSIVVGGDSSIYIPKGSPRFTGNDSSALSTLIYPTNFTDYLNLSITLARPQIIKIVMYDLQGILVQSFSFNGYTGSNVFRMNDLSALPIKNYYILSVLSLIHI